MGWGREEGEGGGTLETRLTLPLGRRGRGGGGGAAGGESVGEGGKGGGDGRGEREEELETRLTLPWPARGVHPTGKHGAPLPELQPRCFPSHADSENVYVFLQKAPVLLASWARRTEQAEKAIPGSGHWVTVERRPPGPDARVRHRESSGLWSPLGLRLLAARSAPPPENARLGPERGCRAA